MSRKPSPEATGNTPECTFVATHEKLSQFADSIRQVDLIVSDVTDRGLERIAQMNALSTLTIWSTNLTDAGVAELTSLPQLFRLSFHGKGITDACAPSFAAMVRLMDLELSGTSISDKGLKRIVANRRRPTLDVTHTKATAATVETLRKSHSRCNIRLGK